MTLDDLLTKCLALRRAYEQTGNERSVVHAVASGVGALLEAPKRLPRGFCRPLVTQTGIALPTTWVTTHPEGNVHHASAKEARLMARELLLAADALEAGRHA